MTSSDLEYNIRHMVMEDVDQVHQLDVLSFSLPWPERSFRFELTENPASRMWVAELASSSEDSRVIGMLGLWFIIDEIHIGTLAVLPDFRKKGIAQKLLILALMDACHEGASRAYLEVRQSNQAAQVLYKKFGFKITGIRPHYYSDNGEDALMMTLEPMLAGHLKRFIEK